jgi:hypothetical protein
VLTVPVSACGNAGANSARRIRRIATHCSSIAPSSTTTLDADNPKTHNAFTFCSLLRLLPSECPFYTLPKRRGALLFPSNIPTTQCAINPLRNLPRTPIHAELSESTAHTPNDSCAAAESIQAATAIAQTR